MRIGAVRIPSNLCFNRTSNSQAVKQAMRPVVVKSAPIRGRSTLPHLTLILTGWVIYLGLIQGQARADWINLSGAETAANSAEIYGLDDRGKLVLEVYIADLEALSVGI